ncbi:MAG: PIN domain-containing protein [Pseudomonadota bacterium]
MLDACVLFPPVVRGLLLGAGAAGLIAPHWSARILEEWRRAALAKTKSGPDIPALHGRMEESFPGALLPPDPELEATLLLPDPADAHVVAAASRGAVATIVTFNLKDFPRRTLAGLGMTARHPDDLLWELHSTHTVDLTPALQATAEAFDATSPDATRRLLKRAKLPRLAKAVAPCVPPGPGG